MSEDYTDMSCTEGLLSTILDCMPADRREDRKVVDYCTVEDGNLWCDEGIESKVIFKLKKGWSLRGNIYINQRRNREQVMVKYEDC